MKLRTKLLLSVGLLLLAMALIIYIVPTFFIRKEVYQTADEIHDLLIKDHQQLVRSQQIWLTNVLSNMEQNNNSILLMLNELPKITAQLNFSGKETNAAVWNALAHIASYDPSIGFVQWHDPYKNKAALIRVATANLYPIKKISDQNEFIVISISPSGNHSGEKTQEYKEFIGIRLPKEMQEKEAVTIYALISLDRAKQELSEFQREQEWLLKEKEDASKEEQAYSFTWAMKIGMIRELTPFYTLGLAQKQGNPIVPEGLARLDHRGLGYAILTDEVFSTIPLFNDAEHFKQHHLNSTFVTSLNLPTLSSAPAMVLDNQTHSAYMGNTLRLGDHYLSLGASLNSPAQQLALATNKTILLEVKKSFWLGYDGEGSPIRNDAMNHILSNLSSSQDHNNLPSQRMQKKEDDLTSKKFYFGMISSLYHGNLVFYDFHSMGGEESIVNTLLALENQLSRRISLQLLLIAIGAMILILFLVARMAFTIINPITKLAAATQKVASGRYGEVDLPNMDQRKDEVAILTHSFADMVSGLKEREKIRGVLDKVVSKEVANEILKTQIQLGGEDRIVTMLFSDIRGFTHISSQFSPQKTIKMLNECMDKVSRVIEGEGGVIDKYVGDEVMAIFGAPTTTQDHALRAVSAGILIIETLKKWNEERQAAGEMIIQMGVGIHTGLVVAGNMGAEDRLNYTVVGAHVNLAERLCEVAKPNQLIISAATLAEPNIESSFYVSPLSPIIPKGLTEPIQIYEITGFKWEMEEI